MEDRNLKSSSPETLSLTPKGSDGSPFARQRRRRLRRQVRWQGISRHGSDVARRLDLLIAKNGARAIDLTWKKDGKDMYKSTLAASAGGRVLTETGSAAGDK